jgi:hypothetical protein
MMRTSSGIVCAVAGALSFAVACSWGGAAEPPKPDAPGAAHCGDGVCSASEVNNCPADCGSGGGHGSGSNVNAVCGNGTCETGENSTNCNTDCGGGSGSGSGSATGNCPSDVTQCFACIVDATMCPTGLDATSCLTCIINGGGQAGCDGGAADGVCQADETNATCPADCP